MYFRRGLIVDIRPGSVLSGPDGAEIVVLEMCGRGGFGVVYKGRLPNGDFVAVKTMITGGLDADELAALQNEARIAGRIVDEHVVRVLHFDDGERGGGTPPYLVMEYVAGGSLRDLLTNRAGGVAEQLGREELLDIWEQVAAGMSAVSQQLVHRDLKPENILVDAERSRLKVSDFGLAKLVGATTRAATFKGAGTYAYMSPEAFDLEANTPAMDMYAAGIMFYELAVLQLPIRPEPAGDVRGAWRKAHRLTHPRPLHEVRGDLPPTVSLLITDMLAKNPAGRPATWEEVRRRLRAESNLAGAPDVTGLIAQATVSRIRRSAAAARAEEQRQQEADRRALLESAWETPLARLKAIIAAFNEKSGSATLRFKELGPFRAVVQSDSTPDTLLLTGVQMDDVPMGHHGYARLAALVQLDPQPRPRDREELHSHESFGGFNLLYRVMDPANEFGDWRALRFEHSPLSREGQYPHWFGLGGLALDHELRHLAAMGLRQHQMRPLSDEWFLALIKHLM